MKTYRLFFVSVYRLIWNTFLYDISSILLIIIFKLIPFRKYPLNQFTTMKNIGIQNSVVMMMAPIKATKTRRVCCIFCVALTFL